MSKTTLSNATRLMILSIKSKQTEHVLCRKGEISRKTRSTLLPKKRQHCRSYVRLCRSNVWLCSIRQCLLRHCCWCERGLKRFRSIAWRFIHVGCVALSCGAVHPVWTNFDTVFCPAKSVSKQVSELLRRKKTTVNSQCAVVVYSLNMFPFSDWLKCL